MTLPECRRQNSQGHSYLWSYSNPSSSHKSRRHRIKKLWIQVWNSL